ncbi:MAG TPA: hypothetical protein VMJ32_17185 [Pirellulales bacterium]|nr:hypothetical protein [Pirellulales bacterium]
MIKIRRQIRFYLALGFFTASLFLALSSVTRADPLTLNITYDDMTSGQMFSTSVSTLDFQGLLAGSLSGNYGGIVGYSVSGFANVPGSLSTTDIYVENLSSIAHHIVVTFDAELYSLPRSPVQIDTEVSTDDESGEASHQSSFMSLDSLGGVLFSRDNVPLGTLDSGPVPGGIVLKSGPYELKQVYNLWVVNNGFGIGSTISAAMRMDVAATPEPWTIAGFAAMLPVGLAYLWLRRRRLKAFNAG